MLGLAARAVLAGDELLHLLRWLWLRSGRGNNEEPFQLFSRRPVLHPLFPHQVGRGELPAGGQMLQIRSRNRADYRAASAVVPLLAHDALDLMAERPAQQRRGLRDKQTWESLPAPVVCCRGWFGGFAWLTGREKARRPQQQQRHGSRTTGEPEVAAGNLPTGLKRA